MIRLLVNIIFLSAITSCSLFPKLGKVGDYRISSPEATSDALEFYGLPKALELTAERLRSSSKNEIRFGEHTISKEDYALSLLELKRVLDLPLPLSEKEEYIRKNFHFLELRAESGWGQAYVTGYYAPRFEGRLQRTRKYSAPIYSTPKDILKIDIGSYYRTNPGLQRSGLLEQIRDGQLRGRLTESNGQKYVVPYFDRADATSRRLKADIICYLDPVDAFFLEIQGSGEVILPNGEVLLLNYADQNGHPYYPIGKALKDVIPIEEMSMQRIEKHLRTLSLDEQRKILNLNPSYVFFRPSKQKALTAFGIEAQPGRSMAVDTDFLPHGSLVLLEYPNPDNLGESRTQYFLSHDTGGAIRGPGRVDLFWGHGDLAAALSGGLKGPGRLKVLLPRKPQKAQ